MARPGYSDIWSNLILDVSMKFFKTNCIYLSCSLMAQMVKNLLQGRPGFNLWVWDDPLEKGIATHSSILAWRVPWKEEPGVRVRHDWATNIHISICLPIYKTIAIGEERLQSTIGLNHEYNQNKWGFTVKEQFWRKRHWWMENY